MNELIQIATEDSAPSLSIAIHEELQKKVDESVLEELMRHIVTRQELKKTLEKKLAVAHDANLEDKVQAVMMKIQQQAMATNGGDNVHDALSNGAALDSVKTRWIDPLEQKITKLSKLIMLPTAYTPTKSTGFRDTEAPEQTVATSAPTTTPQSKEDMDLISDRLSREFDEKLFLLSSDVEQCRSLLQQTHSTKSTQRYAQFRWTSGTLKFGATVPWNEQVTNTDAENIKWSGDSSSVIRVQEAGIYEITFAFFSKTKPTLHLIINDDSVMSAIHSPSYVVHHAEASSMAQAGGLISAHPADNKTSPSVTGCSLIDFLSLPARSTVAIHFFGKSRATGFLGLRRL